MRDEPIQRIMTTPAWVVGPDSTLEEAARLMARERLHHLPVVDGQRLAGILSASDLIGRDAPDAGQLRVGAVMQAQPLAISRTSTLQEAATRLAAGGIHALPVTDLEGRVLGIVTSTDLIGLLLRQLAAPEAGTARGDGAMAERLAELEQVRLTAELYLRSGHGEHEHAALTRALAKARETAGEMRIPPGRL
ncbi:MAG: CBS domain-containing protein [Gammaproteobacteria bacterium]|jgi:CBS domain-containing protein|nr:CBS domain-containing protein [Gammaproteobacteria bacterium]